MKDQRSASHYGEEAAESDMEQAEALVEVELGRLGWKEAELGKRRKGDPKKVEMALRLRKDTTMTTKSMAGRLKVGAPGSLSNLLGTVRK